MKETVTGKGVSLSEGVFKEWKEVLGRSLKGRKETKRIKKWDVKRNNDKQGSVSFGRSL